VHSHKLATALMRLAIESTASDFGFYSWTPVSGFPTETADGRWTLSTSKGDITAKEIIFCTNAHTPNFFPNDDPLHTQ
jgi:glycine/D-amino acid oxidase-like deaminating enzyme